MPARTAVPCHFPASYWLRREDCAELIPAAEKEQARSDLGGTQTVNWYIVKGSLMVSMESLNIYPN